MRIAEIMSRDVEFVAPDACVKEAAELMGEMDVGALPVGAPDDLQGIVTDRDLLLRVVAAGRDPTRTKVREIMSASLFTCKEGDSLAQAMELMGSTHVRRLPVVTEDGIVVGWVTLSDVSSRLLQDCGTLRDALAELTGSNTSPAAGSA